MKLGLVLEGGAYRGIFSTGVLKVIRKYNIDFRYIVGVSAGAGNIADYISGNDDISKNYIALAKNKHVYGVPQIFRCGQMVNLDEMLHTLMTINDNEAAENLKNNPCDLEIVCTNCLTARPEYLFDRKSISNLIDIGKASCSIPILCKPIVIGGTPYVDGSVSDAIPLKHALVDKGCDKCIVIMTRGEEDAPTNYKKASALIHLSYHKKYPALEHVLMHRTENYAKQVAYMNRMEQEGKAFVIRPSIPRIDRFETDTTKLQNFYIHGIDTMEKRIEELKSFIDDK